MARKTSFLRTRNQKPRVSPEDVLAQLSASQPMQQALGAVGNMRAAERDDHAD
jgi:hypothetical protein